MGIFKGGALRILQSSLYAIIFLCAAIVLGIYSYFLSVLADRHETIFRWEKAVEGLSGAAVLYLIAATLLTCCLGGVSFFAFLAIVLDLLFCGAMIAIAVMTRHGASSCKGFVRTPLGNGQAGSGTGGFDGQVTYSVHLKTACKLNTAVFAVSIIGALLFLVTAALQVALVRHHKKEKRYGPSPKNNYTSGTSKRRGLFARKNKHAEKDAELGAAGAGVGGLAVPVAAHDNRASYETGTTMANDSTGPYDKVDNVHGTHGTHAPHGTHGGYYTQPQGTGVNPYGYEHTTPHHVAPGTATNY